NTIFASFLDNGSVSWLYYADRLMEFPTALLGVALGTVLLPSLSKYHSASDEGEYSKLLDWGLRLTFIFAAPAAVALALLSVPLVTTLFHYGQFGEHDVWMTRQALMAYSAGLLGLILVKVLAPGFYARQNIATPVRIAIVTLIATQLMNAVFVGSLKPGGLEQVTGVGPHTGLALAIGVGACLNAGLLYRKLREHGIYRPQPGWGLFALKVVAALAAMAVVLWLAMGPALWWFGASGMTKATAVTGLVLLGGAAYFASLWLLGFRLGDFSRRAA
ncbi:MAG TPA: lipid II flippase MurJ, partial [Burkholderiales bacterium]|nr:lipid II flippase MurJ [Burkholderiales bacterium]